MLETRDLVKVYKPKKGVPVTALNGISLKFPETGMVFLLGKSGSGKSTLLNVLGGLDRFDSGEILINGQSAKTFRQQHFDSYRNTYVGFIFQEYNVLEEFSVGANIALALQLQGIKPTDEQINTILREVDLEGYGNRKPNELSGGQKQRVAIARALVKSPKIIMADEPTGALDSVTGRQILTTLKKLSKDKLVIVVSHDREFAEQYADRIVELADGRVIRDVHRVRSELPPQDQTPLYEADSVSLCRGYHLTEADRKAICDYIERMVEQGKPPKIDVSEAGHSSFHPTDQAAIKTVSEGYHLIKSKLPMKYAFKMGASGLKYKKFRLVMTILLSCVAFVLFGLADTMASYNYVDTCTSSLSDPSSGISYVAFEKLVGAQEDDYIRWDYGSMVDRDYERIRENTGLTMYPVYGNANWWDSGIRLEMDFGSRIPPTEDFAEQYALQYYYRQEFAGYVEVSDALLADMGATLVAGRLPVEGSDELAISTFLLGTFQKYGYLENETDKVTVTKAEDMLGKTLTLDGIAYTVCGVVDPGMDFSRYETLKETLPQDADFMDQVLQMALSTELEYALNYSLGGLAMVAPGQIQRIYTSLEDSRDLSRWFYLQGEDFWQNQARYGTLDRLSGQKIVWLDGEARESLSDGEVILSEEEYMNWFYSSGSLDPTLDFTTQYASPQPDYSGIRNMALTLYMYQPEYQQYDVRIVGIIPQGQECKLSHVISDGMMAKANISREPIISQTIAVMPESNVAIRKVVEFSAEAWPEGEGQFVKFELQNPVSFELTNLDEIFQLLRSVFVVIGVVFVVFASLLFSNFIATSISYKKREIGILRAIGSRSNDVFRIFFAESFVIAMINFVVSLTGTAVICGVINHLVRNEAGLLLTVLNVGIRQVALLLGICLLVALVASFLPVRRIAAKRPIDAIRDR